VTLRARHKGGLASARAPFGAAGLLVLLPFWAACDAPPARAEQAPAAATAWHPLGTWSGRGNRQTESFDVTTGALRLTWSSRNEGAPGAGRLRVSLHSAISGRPLQTAVEKDGTGNGTAYLEDEPRVSYLVVESEQVEWSVVLEEAVPTAAGARVP
jgi:hypothetical protein